MHATFWPPRCRLRRRVPNATCTALRRRVLRCIFRHNVAAPAGTGSEGIRPDLGWQAGPLRLDTSRAVLRHGPRAIYRAVGRVRAEGHVILHTGQGPRNGPRAMSSARPLWAGRPLLPTGGPCEFDLHFLLCVRACALGSGVPVRLAHNFLRSVRVCLRQGGGTVRLTTRQFWPSCRCVRACA